MAIFEAFRWGIKLSINLLFLKSAAEVINPDVQGTPNFCQQFLPCSLLTYAGGVDELFTINLESKKP